MPPRYSPESVVIADTPAAILEWAAHHIEHVGIHQGEHLFAGPGRTATLPCWPRGALEVAAGQGRGAAGRTYDWDRIRRSRDQAFGILAEILTGRPVEADVPAAAKALCREVIDRWSAEPGRTAADTARAFRAAAVRADQDHGAQGLLSPQPLPLHIESSKASTMNETKESHSTTRTPNRRGAATPSRDGVHRISVPLHPRLSASELIRVLLAAPVETDLHALNPVQVRSLIADVLTQHGYDVLDRSPYTPGCDRHQDARRAVRRAYGPRFTDAPDEQAVLADPLRDVLAATRIEGP